MRQRGRIRCLSGKDSLRNGSIRESRALTPKTEQQIRQRYERLLPGLDERARREWAVSEAMAFGRGGIMSVHRASGLARSTIRRGIEYVLRWVVDRVACTNPGSTPIARMRRDLDERALDE